MRLLCMYVCFDLHIYTYPYQHAYIHIFNLHTRKQEFVYDFFVERFGPPEIEPPCRWCHPYTPKGPLVPSSALRGQGGTTSRYLDRDITHAYHKHFLLSTKCTTFLVQQTRVGVQDSGLRVKGLGWKGFGPPEIEPPCRWCHPYPEP